MGMSFSVTKIYRFGNQHIHQYTNWYMPNCISCCNDMSFIHSMIQKMLHISIQIAISMVHDVVQANVGQKLVEGNILRVFTMSPNRDPQDTFCLNNA